MRVSANVDAGRCRVVTRTEGALADVFGRETILKIVVGFAIAAVLLGILSLFGVSASLLFLPLDGLDARVGHVAAGPLDAHDVHAEAAGTGERQQPADRPLDLRVDAARAQVGALAEQFRLEAHDRGVDRLAVVDGVVLGVLAVEVEQRLVEVALAVEAGLLVDVHEPLRDVVAVGPVGADLRRVEPDRVERRDLRQPVEEYRRRHVVVPRGDARPVGVLERPERRPPHLLVDEQVEVVDSRVREFDAGFEEVHAEPPLAQSLCDRAEHLVVGRTDDPDPSLVGRHGTR